MLGHKLNDYGLNEPNTQYKRKWNNKLNLFIDLMHNPLCGKYKIKGFFTYTIPGFFKVWRYVFDRAVYGYCDWDLWDLDLYYRRLIAASLHQFAKHTNSWNDQEYEEIEDWVEEICDTAGRLDYSLSECDDENEFWEPYCDQVLNKIKMDRNGIVFPDDDRSLFDQYHKRNVEISQEHDKTMHEAFNWIMAHMHDLWW